MDFIAQLDANTLDWFGQHHEEWLTPVMIGFTRVGDVPVVLGLLVLVLLAFLLTGRKATAMLLLASAIGGLGLTYGVKSAVQRPRPDVPWKLVQESSTFS